MRFEYNKCSNIDAKAFKISTNGKYLAFIPKQSKPQNKIKEWNWVGILAIPDIDKLHRITLLAKNIITKIEWFADNKHLLAFSQGAKHVFVLNVDKLTPVKHSLGQSLIHAATIPKHNYFVTISEFNVSNIIRQFFLFLS